jgi:hypothetical protein
MHALLKRQITGAILGVKPLKDRMIPAAWRALDFPCINYLTFNSAARHWFSVAEKSHEQRADAKAFVACIELLASFAQNGDSARLQVIADSVVRSSFEMAASNLTPDNVLYQRWWSRFRDLTAQAPKKSRKSFLVQAALSNIDHRSIKTFGRFGNGDSVGIQEHQSGRNAGPLVTVDERLRLCQMERVSGRDFEQPSLA